MKKFLALYMAPLEAIDEMMKNAKPEDMQKSMDEWMRWTKRYPGAFVDMGAPAGKNKRVTEDGVADVRNEVCGYSVVQANSHEAAAKIFAECPHLEIPGGYVEVVACLDMPSA